MHGRLFQFFSTSWSTCKPFWWNFLSLLAASSTFVCWLTKESIYFRKLDYLMAQVVSSYRLGDDYKWSPTVIPARQTSLDRHLVSSLKVRPGLKTSFVPNPPCLGSSSAFAGTRQNASSSDGHGCQEVDQLEAVVNKKSVWSMPVAAPEFASRPRPEKLPLMPCSSGGQRSQLNWPVNPQSMGATIDGGQSRPVFDLRQVSESSGRTEAETRRRKPPVGATASPAPGLASQEQQRQQRLQQEQQQHDDGPAPVNEGPVWSKFKLHQGPRIRPKRSQTHPARQPRRLPRSQPSLQQKKEHAEREKLRVQERGRLLAELVDVVPKLRLIQLGASPGERKRGLSIVEILRATSVYIRQLQADKSELLAGRMSAGVCSSIALDGLDGDGVLPASAVSSKIGMSSNVCVGFLAHGTRQQQQSFPGLPFTSAEIDFSVDQDRPSSPLQPESQHCSNGHVKMETGHSAILSGAARTLLSLNADGGEDGDVDVPAKSELSDEKQQCWSPVDDNHWLDSFYSPVTDDLAFSSSEFPSSNVSSDLDSSFDTLFRDETPCPPLSPSFSPALCISTSEPTSPSVSCDGLMVCGSDISPVTWWDTEEELRGREVSTIPVLLFCKF